MKLANPNPPYCSSCFGQKPEMAHVDFESYWDGPIIQGKSFKQPIDDLIICRDCLVAAGLMVGLVDNKNFLNERVALKEELKELRAYKAEAEKQLSGIRELV